MARQGKAAGTMSRQANRGTESKKMVTGACDPRRVGVEWRCSGGRGPARGASLNWKGAFYQPWEGVVPLRKKGAHCGSRAETSSGSVPGAGQVGGPLEELEDLFPAT